MAEIKNKILYISILFFISSLSAEQHSPMITEKWINQSDLDYITEGTSHLSNEVKNLEISAIEYLQELKHLSMELMKKQTEPLVKAIKWVEDNDKKNCIEKDYLPDVILSNEFETVENCDGVDDFLDEYLSEIDDMRNIVKSLKEEAIKNLKHCRITYHNIPSSQMCANSVLNSYKVLLAHTYIDNLQILEEEIGNFKDAVYTKFFTCIVTARRSVLNLSRLAASRIRACATGKDLPTEPPQSPSIDFLKIPPPSPIYLHMMKAIGDNDSQY